MAEEHEAPAKGGKGVGGKFSELKHNKIALGLAGILVIFAFLAYRKQRAGSSESIAPGGAGQDYGTGGGNAGSGAVDVSGIEGQIADLTQAFGDFQGQEAEDISTISGIQAQQQGFLETLKNSTDQLGQQISRIGAAQGDDTFNVRADDGSTLPNLPAQIIESMTKNGEHIVDVVKEGSGALYLTNKGGVYGVGPGGVTSGPAAPSTFGSYLGYAAGTKNPGAEMADHGDFSSGKITLNSGGHYTTTNNKGENYTF